MKRADDSLLGTDVFAKRADDSHLAKEPDTGAFRA
jgi:hypothetical protein